MRYGRIKSVLRPGMTLIELLVVVAILMMLAAAIVPRLKPEMERSRVREAARSIQLYLSGARNLAITTGRPCGVMIERLPAENGCAMSLTQVETPLSYGGDVIGAVAKAEAGGGGSAGFAQCKITLSSPTSVALHPGDLIQIGYQGYWMILNTATVIAPGATSFTASLDVSHGEVPPWMVQPVIGPYKIVRWPTKSAAAALQLPSPACIDLTWSGTDPLGAGPAVWPVSAKPVLIMFAPDGTVAWIRADATSWGQQPTTPIYLLVGRKDKVVNPPDAGNAETNLNDFNNLWVAINPSTGLICVTDLASIGVNASVLKPSNDPTAPDSRYYARRSDAMGGK